MPLLQRNYHLKDWKRLVSFLLKNFKYLIVAGTQLATLFKSMKAKYRDESRRLARDSDLVPSPFYKKLGFLETGLNSVDQ